MSDKDKATPRPWHRTGRCIFDVHTRHIASVHDLMDTPNSRISIVEANANADLIVRAVNNLEPLCHALHQCKMALASAWKDGWHDEDAAVAQSEAEAALKAAGWEG